MNIIKKIIIFISTISLDVGMALIIGFLLNLKYNYNRWWFYPFSAFIGISADFDLIWSIINKDKLSNHKYYLTHQPIPMVIILSFIGICLNYQFNFPWPLIPLIYLVHLIHDGFEPQGTLILFGPFSKKTYHFSFKKFFPFIKMAPEKLEVVNTQKWMETYYYQWSGESIIGRIALIIGIILCAVDIFSV